MRFGFLPLAPNCVLEVVFWRELERFLLPSHSTWQSLNSQGMFSASWLWLVCLLYFCNILAILTTWICTAQNSSHGGWSLFCLLDKTWCNKEVQGFGFNLSIECFFLPERWACVVNFYKTRKERARKNKECGFAFSKAPIV